MLRTFLIRGGIILISLFFLASALMYFLFPRTDPITIADKNVEFVMKTERLEVKRKFNLKKMIYNGELSL